MFHLNSDSDVKDTQNWKQITTGIDLIIACQIVIAMSKILKIESKSQPPAATQAFALKW